MEAKSRKFAVGSRHGSWTIIEYPFKSKKVLLRCDCGTEGWYWLSNLSSNKSTKCQKCTNKTGQEKTYLMVVRTAARRGIRWTLSREEWFELSQKDCVYCGRPPSNYIAEYGFLYNGIDRKDSNGIYTLSNCVPSCKICNRAKSDMSQEEFYKWIKDVYDRSI